MPESPAAVSVGAGLSIDHADFEWLRAYLQREASRSSFSQPPELNEDAESDSGSTIEDGPSSRKRAKVAAGPTKTPEFDVFAEPFAEVLARLQGDEIVDSLSFGEERSSGQKPRRKVGWTSTEDLAILATVRRLGTQWGRIAAQLPGRTADAVRNRWHRLQKTHSLGDTEEGRAALDALLLACGVSDEWQAGQDPPQQSSSDSGCIKGSDHGRAMWTPEEDAMIEEGVRRFGCKWRQIASSLPGRSDSSVRNRWMRLQKERAAGRAAACPAPHEQLDAAPASVAALGQPDRMISFEVSSVPAASLASPPGSPMVVVSAPAAEAQPAARPPPFLSLKRRASSRRDAAVAASEPLGFRSPMLGFDLEAFVEAVGGAIDDEDLRTPMGAPMETEADEEGFVTFEVSELPMLCSERQSSRQSAPDPRHADSLGRDSSHRSSDRRSLAPASEGCTHVPAGLVAISGLLTAMAAISIGVSLLAKP